MCVCVCARMQAQNGDQFDEFGHYNSYIHQYVSHWGNMHDYGWYNHCASNDSSNLYDFRPNCVQKDTMPSWELAIEKLTNGGKQSWI